MRRRFWVVTLLLTSAPLSCTAGSSSDPGAFAQRDTLPNGVVRIHYPPLPSQGAATAEADLRLGIVEGDPNLVFGDVAGVDADREGTIYVLDRLASEIRAFDSAGRFLRTIGSRGEGPGEITEASGMILAGDTILWVQDHAKWTMLGLSPEGGEVARAPMPVLAYGHTWDGAVDDTGRIWKPAYHSDEDGVEVRRDGLDESTGRIYLKSLDPASGATDSVYVGDYVGRQYLSQVGNGWWHVYFPYDPQRVTTVDPRGGFWQVHTAAYRVARLDQAGDTTLILEVDADPILLSAGEKAEFVERVGDMGPASRRVAQEVLELMLDTKPLIQKLIVDDEGRLWVERTVEEGAHPLYDLFNHDGDFLGSVELAFRPNPFLPIRIRHGHIYAVALDDLDVPSIVRARVPDAIGGLAKASDSTH